MITATYVYIFFGWLFGGLVSGIAGIGGMMAALPVVLLGMPVTDAILTCCIIGAPGSTQLAWLYRKGLVWTDVLWLWASCVPGCFLGALALKVVPIQWLQIGISLMIACFVVLQLIKKNATFRIKDSAASLLVTGLASGFANSSVSVGGVPIGIFLLFKDWQPDRARSTMAMLFLVSGWATLAGQWFAGLYRPEFFKLAAVGIAAVFIGQKLGYIIGRYVNQRVFIRLLLIFLSLSAVMLLYKALA